ncbi:hypothetical protein PUV54_00025 [Hyphococcus flavus]|uniref:Uncharacterized protein n=1 Tax=Hyphococcus flavus TaxID=1866326 RepID=A0AAE9ZDG6_9PROT|nr:hypothetical protein [Hyphococcus flavus]WDI31580.1 hypothetical protein PUV54_00025 [Hyphococcus flavus]
MKLQMANEAVFSAPMVAAGVWTAITGDTFFPSLAGACFAVYFRSQRKTEGPDGPQYLIKDLIATGAMSLVIGLVAGPYLASQLPDGEGVVGVGALIMAFVGTALLAKLNRMDWDLGLVFKSIADVLHKKNGK